MSSQDGIVVRKAIAVVFLLASLVSVDTGEAACSNRAYYTLQQCIAWLEETESWRQYPDLYERWEVERLHEQSKTCLLFFLKNETRVKACAERMVEEGIPLPDFPRE